MECRRERHRGQVNWAKLPVVGFDAAVIPCRRGPHRPKPPKGPDMTLSLQGVSMRNMICGLALGMLALGLLGCSTEPKTEEAKASLHDDVQATLNDFSRTDSGFKDFLNKGAGYVVFPHVGKG